MNQTVLKMVLIASVAGMSSDIAIAQSNDSGCWSGKTSNGSNCVVSSASRKGERFIVTYTNQCSERVYVRACSARIGQSPDCGSRGIAARGQWNWSSFQATGRYRYGVIGSSVASQDWVCSGKVSNWNAPMF
ncbi:hypothetical protein [Parasphingorhabdus sp.]|uniref:hypothetical protein n=1 Tax=Parasphingorhabdus sp. TaxID=2709688 RepID=UPI003594626F